MRRTRPRRTRRPTRGRRSLAAAGRASKPSLAPMNTTTASGASLATCSLREFAPVEQGPIFEMPVPTCASRTVSTSASERRRRRVVSSGIDSESPSPAACLSGRPAPNVRRGARGETSPAAQVVRRPTECGPARVPKLRRGPILVFEHSHASVGASSNGIWSARPSHAACRTASIIDRKALGSISSPSERIDEPSKGGAGAPR